MGNRTRYTQGALTPNANTRYYLYPQAPATNRLAEIRIGSTSGTIESSFNHNAEGRLTSQTGLGAKTLTWDAKGRVKTVGNETYGYDATDHRIRRSGGALGALNYFLEGEHLESVEVGTTLRERYFRGANIDELVAGWIRDTDGKTKPFLFHHDAVNSVTAVTGHNGGIVQSTTYSAFGKTLATTGSSPNRLKYTGREDDGTGLYYCRARYLDPVTGRFPSEDPLGFKAGINFYAYANNNPINANDPSGMEPGDFFDLNNWSISRGEAIAGKVGSDAEALALQMTGGDRNAANLLIHNGQVDAWRHAEWQRQTAAEMNETFAWLVGTQHEIANVVSWISQWWKGENKISLSQQLHESFMDLSNNFVGRNAAANGATAISYDNTLLTFGPGGINGQPDTGFFGYNAVQGLSGISIADPSLTVGSAAGGFLIYPNKANMNMMQSVYSK